MKENGVLVTDAKEKAEVLNRQFDRAFSEGKVYTPETIEKKCNINKKKCHPTIPEITITVEGVCKLLKDTDP